jgi:hypothetical protein
MINTERIKFKIKMIQYLNIESFSEINIQILRKYYMLEVRQFIFNHVNKIKYREILDIDYDEEFLDLRVIGNVKLMSL